MATNIWKLGDKKDCEITHMTAINTQYFRHLPNTTFENDEHKEFIYSFFEHSYNLCVSMQLLKI